MIDIRLEKINFMHVKMIHSLNMNPLADLRFNFFIMKKILLDFSFWTKSSRRRRRQREMKLGARGGWVIFLAF
jgi:hypothetical protein